MKGIVSAAVLAAGLMYSAESASAASKIGIEFDYTDSGFSFFGSLYDSNGDGFLTADDAWDITFIKRSRIDSIHEFGMRGTRIITFFELFLEDEASDEYGEFSFNLSDISPGATFTVEGTLALLPWYSTFGGGGGDDGDAYPMPFSTFGYAVSLPSVPLPAAGIMLLTSLAGLGALSTRRKR